MDGGRRGLLVAAAVFVLGAVTTSAATISTFDVVSLLTPPPRFAIAVAANGETSSWVPQRSDWHEADREQLTVGLGEHGAETWQPMLPGETKSFTFAVMNISDGVAADLRVKIDPNPTVAPYDGQTDRSKSLFPALKFTLRSQDGAVVPAEASSGWSWIIPEEVQYSESRVFRVDVTLPPETTNEYKSAGTSLLVGLTAISK